MESAHFNMKTVINILEILKMILEKEKDFAYIKIKVYSMEIIEMTK